MISRGCFTTENECPGYNMRIRIFFDPVIQMNDVKNIQLLAFVFMDSFHHNVKHGCRIYQDT